MHSARWQLVAFVLVTGVALAYLTTRFSPAAASLLLAAAAGLAAGAAFLPGRRREVRSENQLVQALGVFFTVATVTLAFNLTAAGLLTTATALPGAVAMAASFAGMFIGQAVRTRMQPEVFRRWFLIAMFFLGLYLAGSALVKLHG